MLRNVAGDTLRSKERQSPQRTHQCANWGRALKVPTM
jgi:hypothetical protein